MLEKQREAMISSETIRNLIYMVRGKQVMLDSDLAILYQVETKRLNEAVKRNITRFPDEFRFQLTEEEYTSLRSQFATSKEYLEKVFFEGQIYDAFSLFVDLVSSANKTIILIDNYVDIGTLNILTKKKENVSVCLYTSNHTKLTEKDIENFNKQYPILSLKYTKVFHDRFLILDRDRVYHIGASLKDAGKRCFAISLLEDNSIMNDIFQRLEFEEISS